MNRSSTIMTNLSNKMKKSHLNKNRKGRERETERKVERERQREKDRRRTVFLGDGYTNSNANVGSKISKTNTLKKIVTLAKMTSKDIKFCKLRKVFASLLIDAILAHYVLNTYNTNYSSTFTSTSASASTTILMNWSSWSKNFPLPLHFSTTSLANSLANCLTSDIIPFSLVTMESYDTRTIVGRNLDKDNKVNKSKSYGIFNRHNDGKYKYSNSSYSPSCNLLYDFRFYNTSILTIMRNKHKTLHPDFSCIMESNYSSKAIHVYVYDIFNPGINVHSPAISSSSLSLSPLSSFIPLLPRLLNLDLLFNQIKEIFDPSLSCNYIKERFRVVLKNPIGIKVNSALSEFLTYGLIENILQRYKYLFEILYRQFAFRKENKVNKEKETEIKTKTEMEREKTMGKEGRKETGKEEAGDERTEFSKNLVILLVLQLYHCFTLYPFIGLSGAFALLFDLFHLSTLHLQLIHYILSIIYSLEVSLLTSLFTLFLGYKYNILNQRVDHVNETNMNSQQLLFSTLVFTIIAFLFPTILVFYLISSSIYLFLPLTFSILYFVYQVVYHFPLQLLLPLLKWIAKKEEKKSTALYYSRQRDEIKEQAQEKKNYVYRKISFISSPSSPFVSTSSSSSTTLDLSVSYFYFLLWLPREDERKKKNIKKTKDPKKTKNKKKNKEKLQKGTKSKKKMKTIREKEKQEEEKDEEDEEEEEEERETERKALPWSKSLLIGKERLPSISFWDVFLTTFFFSEILSPLLQSWSLYLEAHLRTFLFGKYLKFNYNDKDKNSN